MEYRTPLNPGFLGSQWRPKLAALLAFVLVNEIATEYLAWAFLRLGYFFESARFHIAGVGLYHPFCWIKWEVQYWRWVLHPTPPMSKPLWIAVAIFLIGGLLGSKLISQIVHTLSATLGTFTVQHASFNFNQKPKLLLDGEGVSANLQNTKRALAEPEELMALETPRREGDRVTYPGEFVMTIFGCPPVKGRQGFWFLDPKVAKRVHLPITNQANALSVDFFKAELEKVSA